nr:L-histidine N(alpha)-methyltransferase [Janibacter limosus]
MTSTQEQTDQRHELEEDLREGFWADPPTLPPRWFYDERGSRLFDRITSLPEYYPTRAEREILQQRSAQILEVTGARSVHELGAGTSAKTGVLLDELTAGGRPATYAPLDISSEVLPGDRRAAAERVPHARGRAGRRRLPPPAAAGRCGRGAAAALPRWDDRQLHRGRARGIPADGSAQPRPRATTSSSVRISSRTPPGWWPPMTTRSGSLRSSTSISSTSSTG